MGIAVSPIRPPTHDTANIDQVPSVDISADIKKVVEGIWWYKEQSV